MRHYILVIKNTSRDKVMDSCFLAEEYEQVGADVHCWYSSKRYATEDSDAYARANPRAERMLYRLFRSGTMLRAY